MKLNRIIFVLIGGGILILLLVFYVNLSPNEPTIKSEIKKQPMIKDTLKRKITYKSDTVKVKTFNGRLVPEVTKYRVNEVVCAAGKWTGVVREIGWSSYDPNALIYRVESYTKYGNDVIEWTDGWYHDIELKTGKCN